MKTLLALAVALLAASLSLAQSAPGNPAGSPGPVPVLNHEDSLVLAEAAKDTAAPDSLKPRVLPLQAVIDAVLGDFPHNLRHITGELVLAQGEFENYMSTVVLQGAEDKCIITRYHSSEDTTVSWQARMFTSDEYDKAAQMYKDLYKKLQRCYVRLVDKSVLYLVGDWEPAREEAAFTTSTLRVETGDWRYKHVKVELELVYLMADWAVNINIVSKQRDDQVGGGQGVTLIP